MKKVNTWPGEKKEVGTYFHRQQGRQFYQLAM